MGKMTQMQKTMKNAFNDVEHIVFENKKYNTNNFESFLPMVLKCVRILHEVVCEHYHHHPQDNHQGPLQDY